MKGVLSSLEEEAGITVCHEFFSIHELVTFPFHVQLLE